MWLLLLVVVPLLTTHKVELQEVVNKVKDNKVDLQEVIWPAQLRCFLPLSGARNSKPLLAKTYPLYIMLAIEGNEAPFRDTAFFVMGATSGTSLTMTRTNGMVETSTIKDGRSTMFRSDITVGDRLVASNPVQVYLLTGDINANWEMCWYAMLPVEFFVL